MAGRCLRRYVLVLGAALVALAVIAAGASSAPSPPRSTKAPAISGTARVADELSASRGKWRPKPAKYQYRWQVKKTVIKKVRVKRSGKVRVIRRKKTTWPRAARTTTRTFTPQAALTGKQVRVCVRARVKKSPWSTWRCSRPTKAIAAAAPAASPPAASPSPPAASPPAADQPAEAPVPALSLSYASGALFTGRSSQQITPTVSGGAGTKSFSYTGTLPTGVSFDTSSGVFTGPAASAWNFRATQVATGDYFACALTVASTVKCWGQGTSGQLGNGTTTAAQSTPVDVHTSSADSTPMASVAQIAIDKSTACALTTAGRVKCWGVGTRGQLGDGTTTSVQSTPVDVHTSSSDSSPLTGVGQVSVGGEGVCALTTTGTIKCWGLGASGQLGNNTTTAVQRTPVDVHTSAADPHPLGNIVQVAKGYEHACALTTSGGVKCWGNDLYGPLGVSRVNDGIQFFLAPVDTVDGNSGLLTGVSTITAGYHTTCAVTSSGTAKCWGYNVYGQLGVGSFTTKVVPQDVHTAAGDPTPLANISRLTAGFGHTCALTTAATVKCWGRGDDGQRGDNTTTQDQDTPVDVHTAAGNATPLPNVAQVSSGRAFTCALTTSGAVRCWGRGTEGQLGDGTTTSAQSTPVGTEGAGAQPGFPAALTVNVSDTTGSVAASVTLVHGPASWFAYPTTRFTMGQGAQQLAPTVFGGAGTRSFAYSGTLPAGVSFNSVTGAFSGPAASAWNFRATQIASGRYHTCALTTSGSVKCWGKGNLGQLGNSSTSQQGAPVDVHASQDDAAALSGVTAIAAGDNHTCALTTAGGVKCWGSANAGELGNGANPSYRSAPADVRTSSGDATPLANVTHVAAGSDHTCAVTTSGGAKCWGGGAYGQRGDNSLSAGALSPVDVHTSSVDATPLAGISAISTGRYTTCALTTAGGVKCWGYGTGGELGDGTNTARQSTPVDVRTSAGDASALSNIAQVSVGWSHTCVRTTSSGVKCWGQNSNGELGNNDNVAQTSPVDVHTSSVDPTPLAGVARVTSGGAHSCALTTAGGVTCWGLNLDGQIGDGTTTVRTTPVDVRTSSGDATPLAGMAQVSAGYDHNCAITAAGGVKCWGWDQDGQLGDGATDSQSSPVDTQGSGEQAGFPAELSVTVTDDGGSWTLGRLVMGTR